MRCPFPSSFALCQGTKFQDRLTIDCRGAGSSPAAGSSPSAAIWAVFDGHRSHDVAGHAARLVPGLVWASPFWPHCPGDALRTALCECHEMARHEELVGGSTAVVVATVGGTVWCGSAGDSRAVAGLRGGGVRRLSVDHTTDAPEEVARVKAAGGCLEWGRLGGSLPMTRGLGNFHLEADGFTCLAHVASVPRHQVDFVVLASDGLWDVISDEQCCALVREWGGGPSAAERLAAHARRIGSADDIAVVVAFFPQEGAAAAARAALGGA